MDRREPWNMILPPDRSGLPASPDIVEQRATVMPAIEALHAHWPCLPSRKAVLGGVRCVILGDEGADRDYIHFHGGGYRLGDPLVWLAFMSRIAAGGGVRILLPDYRLAPEHPFPAAIRDAVRVYAALRADGRERIFAGGDSAGGGIATALAALAVGSSLPVPSGLVLISPWLDLTASAPSYAGNADVDMIFSRESAQLAADAYLQGVRAAEPFASPLFADAAIFPPVQLFCGTEEVLLDDSTRFVAHLAQHRRSVEAHFIAGMQHVWPMIAPDLLESAALVAHVRRFLGLENKAR